MIILKRVYSWLLALAYLGFGVTLLALVPKLQESFSGFVSLQFILRTMFALGPYGCFVMAAAVAALLIFNDIRYHRRFVSLGFSVVLVVLAYQLAAAIIPDFDFH